MPSMRFVSSLSTASIIADEVSPVSVEVITSPTGNTIGGSPKNHALLYTVWRCTVSLSVTLDGRIVLQRSGASTARVVAVRSSRSSPPDYFL